MPIGDASDFGRFREGRVFTFLHLFSGPNDRLAAALKEEGAKAGLKVSVDSVDIKMDKSMDLRKGPAVEEIEKRITQGNYDGFHAGFPCGSFSRVRWVESAGMPGPVRSRQFPYGLPSNSPKQQEEADDGTLMATRSLGLMQKQIWSQRSRRVPQAATVENPLEMKPGPQVAPGCFRKLKKHWNLRARAWQTPTPAHIWMGRKGSSNQAGGLGAWRTWSPWQRCAGAPHG